MFIRDNYYYKRESIIINNSLVMGKWIAIIGYKVIKFVMWLFYII